MPIFDPNRPLDGEVIDASTASDANWKQSAVTTNSSSTVKGLTNGTRHWFRVSPLIGNDEVPEATHF